MVIIILIAIAVVVLVGATICFVIMFNNVSSKIYYDTSYGEPVDYTAFKRVDWKQLPTSKHPIDSTKHAKIQSPFFIANVGYFILFKTCKEDGTMKDAHEYIKCICKNGALKNR
jgi:hypothetical protein